jgi:hypothetical protein
MAPAAPEMLLIGGDVSDEASAACGAYRISPRRANGRPVWRQVEPGGTDRWVVLGTSHWFVLQLGTWEGSLRLADARCASPNRSLHGWEVHDACGQWVSQPGLWCRAATEGEAIRRDPLGHVEPLAPAAVLIEGGDKLAPEAASCCGWYTLEPGVQVNGRPAWSHAVLSDRVLAYDGSSWQCQARADRGSRIGYLQLPDASCAAPHLSRKSWRAPGQPKITTITCRAASARQLSESLKADEAAMRAELESHPPPEVLCLSADPPPVPAADPCVAHCVGNYRLCPGRFVNGRPTWRRHGAHGHDLYLAYDGVSSWCVQQPCAEGAPIRLLHLVGGRGDEPGSSPLACDGRAWHSNGDGAGWQPIPGMRCEAVATLRLPPNSHARSRHQRAASLGRPLGLEPVIEGVQAVDEELLPTDSEPTSPKSSYAIAHYSPPPPAKPQQHAKPQHPSSRRRLAVRSVRAC